MVQPINPGGNPLIFVPDSFNLPDVSKLSYDESKRFFGMVFQQNKPWFDFDINEFSNELNYWIIKTAQGIFGTDNNNAYRMIGVDNVRSLQPLESSTNSNNLKFLSGTVFQGGRFIDVPTDVEYNDDTVNYICLGQVTTITETVPAIKYTIQDSEKLFNVGYQLESCRIKFLSGNLSGSTFDIENIDGYNFIVSGDLSTAVVGDTYRILPPALTTPTADATVDNIYFVSWFEDISPKENRVLENPTTQDAYNVTVNAALDDPIWGTDHPSHRKQLRWCLFANRTQVVTTDVTGIQVGTSHLSTSICTIQRDNGDANILQETITDVENYYYTLAKTNDLIKGLDNQFPTSIARINNLYVDNIYPNTGTTIDIPLGSTLKVDSISEYTASNGTAFTTKIKVDNVEANAGSDVIFNSSIKVDSISETTLNNKVSIPSGISTDLITNINNNYVTVENGLKVGTTFYADTIQSLSGLLSGITINDTVSITGALGTSVINTDSLGSVSSNGIVVGDNLSFSGSSSTPDIRSNSTLEYFGSVQFVSGTTFQWGTTPIGFDANTAPQWDTTAEAIILLLANNITDQYNALSLCVTVTTYINSYNPHWYTSSTPITQIYVKLLNNDHTNAGGQLGSFSIMIKDLG